MEYEILQIQLFMTFILTVEKISTEAVDHIRSTGKLYGVLGSSIGWHVFYGALTWQVRARGWEILCSQVDIFSLTQYKLLGGGGGGRIGYSHARGYSHAKHLNFDFRS